MEEKIKIYIPKAVNNILLKDMERFEFFKKDNSFNKNEFYNTLIMNYHEEYENRQSMFFDYFKKTIQDNTDSSEFTINNIANIILEYVDQKTNNLDEQKSEVTISIKPTRKTKDTIDYIQNQYLRNSTLSSYFRNMLASYTSLPQDKREMIIFKDNFKIIKDAIKANRTIYFTTSKSNTPHIVSPYSITNSKEELFNYLLAEDNELPLSFRIGRLRKIIIQNEQRNIKEENILIFKQMIEYGPQFSYDVKTPYEEIQIKLTEIGKQMYHRIYLHRPRYTKVENDIYYFSCSRQQAYQYFSRFGDNAIVLKPKILFDEIKEFYTKASKAYKKIKSQYFI